MAFIFFGNLNIEELERRTGWKFTESERKWLNEHRQNDASVRTDSESFHIFDIPLSVVVSPKIKAEIIDLLGNKDTPKERISIIEAVETEQERIERRIAEEKREKEKRRLDSNARWMKKWHLVIPLDSNSYYMCFFNTVHTGWENIPVNVCGDFEITRNQGGFFGNFHLDDPKLNESDTTHVIGLGIYDNNGNRMWKQDNLTIHFSGRIENYLSEEKSYVMEW